MPDPDATDGCDARITGPQRAQLAEVMRALRMHGDPAVELMPRDRQRHGALVRLRPQSIGPAAVAAGTGSYAIAALTPWWLTLVLGLGLLALLVYAGRHDLLEVDRVPSARLLRR